MTRCPEERTEGTEGTLAASGGRIRHVRDDSETLRKVKFEKFTFEDLCRITAYIWTIFSYS